MRLKEEEATINRSNDAPSERIEVGAESRAVRKGFLERGGVTTYQSFGISAFSSTIRPRKFYGNAQSPDYSENA